MKLTDIISIEDDVILLSIREPYFQNIVSGVKRYEYRKVFKKHQTKAIIYISKTKKSIIGLIEFDQPIIDTSVNVALMAERIGESDYNDMIDYLGIKEKSYAIPVKNVYLFEEEYKAVDFHEHGIKFTAPQSYINLNENNKLLNFLMDKTIKQVNC